MTSARPAPESDMTRREIFDRLRSFDHAELDGDAFERAALDLLDPAVVHVSTAAELHAHFLRREPPIDEPPPLHPTKLPDDLMRVVDQVLKNVFEYYGERHALGPDFDWTKNPGNDHWIHDLSRFHDLAALVEASRRTGDDRYTRKAAELTLDWVRKNDICDSWFWTDVPMRESPNVPWFSYLNIAIHCQRWATHWAAMVPFWMPQEMLFVLKGIHDQLLYLELIIPTMANNWMVIGGDGMLGTALRLPELRDAQRFVDYAWTILAAEGERQVLPDGVQFELTQSYHVCVLRLLLNSVNLSRAAGVPVPGGIDETVDAMIDYTMQNVTPDGLTVAFNDSDAAAGPVFCEMLAREGRRRNRADWLYVGSCGAEGAPPPALSQAFEHGGVYIMRTGWDRDATFLAFDGGPWGEAHQHDDRLAFWLSALGRSFLIDPGRYLYDRNNPFSYDNYLRATRAHSTITIDGQGQADRFFRDRACPGPKLTDNTWLVTDAFQRVAGAHMLGYGANGGIRVEHRRSITFWPEVGDAGAFLVLDRLTGEGEHDVHSRLQFCPGDVVQSVDVWHTTFGHADLAALPFVEGGFDAHVEKGQLDPASGWYSDSVNHIEPSPTLVVHARAALPLRAAFLLVPFRGDVPDLSVTFDGDGVRCAVAETSREVGFTEAMR
jgi:hypothetical protein